jgi:PKHD-type hydroxylase
LNSSITEQPSLVSVCLLRSVFSEAEVRTIRSQGKSSSGSDWWIGPNERDKRSASSTTIANQTQTSWIFDRLNQVGEAANTRYGFDVTSVDENILFARYNVGDFFDWHVDLGEDTIVNRKLSIVVVLSDPTEFSGGSLQFQFDDKSAHPAAAGSAYVFPSYLPHRVAPVLSGVRYSMVAWMCGPSFR